MKNYAVFYADRERLTEAAFEVRDGEKATCIPRSVFKQSYRFVGVHQAENLHRLFDLLNGELYLNGIQQPHPLGDPQIQDLVIEGIPGHTSMSVGDVAVDLETGQRVICASIGWSDLELV